MFLLGVFHEQRSLAGYSPWGGKESDVTERLTHALQFIACLFILLLLLLFSGSVVSDSLQPHVLQHTRLLCHSPSPRVSSNSCPLSRSCHPVILSSLIPFSCLQSFPPSGSFSGESALCTRWPRYWSFSFNISYFNEYSGLFSFRINSFDLLAVQGTLKSFLQNHSLKASVLSFF